MKQIQENKFVKIKSIGQVYEVYKTLNKLNYSMIRYRIT